MKTILYTTLILFILNYIKPDECSDFERYKIRLCGNFIKSSSERCALINNECIKVGYNYQDYLNNITDIEILKEICENLATDFRSVTKFVFRDNKCLEIYRTCDEIMLDLESSDFEYHTYSPFYDLNCIKGRDQYYNKSKSCNIAKTEESCKSIILLSVTSHTCIWENSTCKVKKVQTCSDFNNLLHPIYCSNIYLENQNTTCIYVNNECKQVYKECSLYDGNDPNECEVILPKNKNMKCVFKNNTCVEELKTRCSDYNNSYYKPRSCNSVQLEDTNKYCSLLNDSCVEQYKRCEYYKGNNKTECENIFPSQRNSICYFINNECIQMEKNSCSQYRPEEDKYACEGIKLNNTDKYCVFVNNRCEEHYKYCWKIEPNKRFTYIYNQCKEPEIHCPSNESLRSLCINNINMHGLKCYIQTASESKFSIDNGKILYGESWIIEGCTELYPSNYCGKYVGVIDIKKCISIIPSNENKKCIINYSDFKCIEVDKQCLDYYTNATNEICENAKASAKNKICKLSNETDKCIEILVEEKKEEIDSTQQIEDIKNDINDDNESNILKTQEIEEEKHTEKENLNSSGKYNKCLKFVLLYLLLF